MNATLPAAHAESATHNPAARASIARAVVLEALLLGLFADSALRSDALGAGWPVWIAALAATTFALARRGAAPLTAGQAGWLALAVTCSALFALVLLGLARWRDTVAGARVRDVIESMLRSFVTLIDGAAKWVVDAAVGDGLRDAASRRTPVLRAIALTVPIILVFGNLLGSADPVFDQLFSLPGVDLGTITSHVAVAGAFAWASAGVMRGVLVPSRTEPVDASVLPRLGKVEVTSMLGATTALFALFVGMQVRWLFGGAEIVRVTTGLSVAEYARRGFFELLAVAVLVMPLILVTGALVAGDEDAERRHRRLSIPTIALLGFILASAVLRMRLYVGYFGLSTDRLYALVFMGWLAFVFGCLVFTALRGRPRSFVLLSVLGGFATLAGLNAVNPERIVAQSQAVGRTGRPVDRAYLASLSGDAMPAVVDWLSRNPSQGTEQCDALRRLRSRWGGEAPEGIITWNAGERSGRRVVLEYLGSQAGVNCGDPPSTTATSPPR